jgi:hypothetical protein
MPRSAMMRLTSWIRFRNFKCGSFEPSFGQNLMGALAGDAALGHDAFDFLDSFSKF